MLGSPILYLKGMRAIMFQLSGFFYRVTSFGVWVYGVQGLESYRL